MVQHTTQRQDDTCKCKLDIRNVGPNGAQQINGLQDGIFCTINCATLLHECIRQGTAPRNDRFAADALLKQ